LDRIAIVGGARLEGEIPISGAKNSAIKLMAASLLTEEPLRLTNMPRLADTRFLGKLLQRLGTEVVEADGEDGPETLLRTKEIVSGFAPYDLVRQMRASVLVLGPLLARYGWAKVSLPGGCAIGARPVDQHLQGLEALGAKIEVEHGFIVAQAPGGLRGAEVVFDMQTVGGTENLMMAAALAKGRTTLVNSACEPEIEELGRVLNKMGAKVEGAGTSTIHIQGKSELQPFDHAVIADRIEAGTFMAAVGLAGGNVLLENAPLEDLEPVVVKLRKAGLEIDREGEHVRVRRVGPLRGVDVSTAPHPGFPTDMQAQLMALCCLAKGESVLTENVFENRFMHVPELIRMGAHIETRGNVAIVRGVAGLSGASVMATDLRASASLVMAGLVADGETIVRRVYHLDRGYEHIEHKLAGAGADIERISLESEEP